MRIWPFFSQNLIGQNFRLIALINFANRRTRRVFD